MTKEATNTATVRERLIEKYNAFKAGNPDVSYAEWLDRWEMDTIAMGRPHATLGPRLRKHENWWDAGAGTFRRYQRWFPFVPSSKVVDYGCGSLRVGGHFIRFLDPGCYIGLDVISGFYEMGKDLVGRPILDHKKPRFDVISGSSVRDAAAFGADFVFSSAVSYHVLPDEAPAYFHNLTVICHKPGANLFFDVSISDAPIHDLQLSMPLDYFKAALPELSFVTFHEIDRNDAAGQTIGILHFRRLATSGVA